ncbi:hypothetical protein Taro_048008, partial [Colocasia esculenta]|nr:hypothetical protein [Colocasia esculenta]
MLQTLRQNDEEKCVDTGSSGVDTRSSSQKAYLPILYSVSTQPEVVSTLETLPREPFVPVWDSVSTHPMGSYKYPSLLDSKGIHARQEEELSGRREEERERSICIQRSRAAPPRGEEGEEEEELKIAGVLVQKEI